jgi:hypothetical protein
MSFSTWARFADKWTRYSVIRSSTLDINAKSENTILIIPGNPGNDGFYTDFASLITESWKKDCQVFILAHLNHIPLPQGLAKIDNTQLSRKHLYFKYIILILQNDSF